MSVKKIVTGSLIGASMLAAPSAFAGWTGNVGATSNYLFRGAPQGNAGDAAVQGGVDWSHDSGLYAGTWVSNVGFAGNDGGAEMDLYLGYGGDIVDGLGYDVGILYYWYPSEDENANPGDELSTLEFYAGLSYGPASLTYYYSDECNFFLGNDADLTAIPAGNFGNSTEEAGYLSLGVELPITETLAFTASIGHYHGDEIERFLAFIGSTDDDYIDYSIGIAKDAGNGMSFTLQLIDTDVETAAGDDEITPVIGFNKSFDL